MFRGKTRCPGCSRHCHQGNVRCKYGLKHFEKEEKKRKAECIVDTKHTKLRKWEKHVQRGGLLWQFLWVGSLSKRALRKKQLDEVKLLAALDEQEQEQLHQLLKKLVDHLMHCSD